MTGRTFWLSFPKQARADKKHVLASCRDCWRERAPLLRDASGGAWLASPPCGEQSAVWLNPCQSRSEADDSPQCHLLFSICWRNVVHFWWIKGQKTQNKDATNPASTACQLAVTSCWCHSWSSGSRQSSRGRRFSKTGVRRVWWLRPNLFGKWVLILQFVSLLFHNKRLLTLSQCLTFLFSSFFAVYSYFNKFTCNFQCNAPLCKNKK